MSHETLNTPLRDWPESEQPVGRLFARGPAALSDAELLSLFVPEESIPGGDPVAACRALLMASGGLRPLLDRMTTAGSYAPDLDPPLPASARAALIGALELASRHLSAGLERGEAFHTPDAMGRYFAHRLRGQPREVFAVAFMDTRHRVLAYEELFYGTIDGAEVHPREVVRRALAHNAAAAAVAHNHPSGNAEPSAADRAVTAQLKQALALVDVRLLDHFVIGDGAPVSMAARGLI